VSGCSRRRPCSTTSSTGGSDASGFLLKADYGPLENDSIHLDVVITGGGGASTLVVIARWAPQKIGFGDGALRDRAEKLVRTVAGYQLARDNELGAPTTPPPESPPPGA
jgi:hypothetical protein